MRILSINRNLLSKFRPKSLPSSSSSDLCFFRKIHSGILPPGTIDPQQAHHPTVFGDLNRKSMFLIEHENEGNTNYSLLSAAAAENNNSWKDHHERICSPSLGRLVGSCKEWTLFQSLAETDLLVVDKKGFSKFQTQCKFSLWNPKTNCIKTIPPSLLPRRRPILLLDIECFGFGFDPKSEDYKLICFLEDGLRHISFTSNSPREVNIEVYSLKTNLWKKITPPPTDNVAAPYFHFHSVHINGVYYWARDNILSFDFVDEKFSHISLPDAPHLRRMHKNYFLAEFHGSLAVVVPFWVPIEDLTEEEKKMQQPFSMEIWVWNGKAWNVVPKVAVGDFPVGDSIARVLAFFQNEYLFLQGWNKGEIMVFNCKTGKLENLGIDNDPPESRRIPGIFPFTVPI